MPFDAGTVEGKLDLDAKKFLAELKRVEDRLDRVEAEAKQAREATASFGSRMLKVAAGIGAAAASFLALRAALRGVTAGLSKASQDAAEFEQVVQELGVSLGLAGVQNISEAVEGLKDWASAVQSATAFSDSYVLKVAQTLTILGVQQDQLQTATKAVLDYASATGRDAVESARQFGKTLGGTLGELSEAFPALKNLTQEQLRAGEAFTFAAERLGGFSEQVADTTEGLRARLENTIGDFSKQVGALINPFLNELRRAGIDVVEELTTLVGENRVQIAETFKEFTLGIIDAIPGAIDAITSLRVTFTQTISVFARLGPAMAGTFAQLALTVTEANLAVNKLFATFGDEGAAQSVAALAERADLLRKTVDEAAAEYGRIAREAENAARAAQKQGDAVRARLLPVLEKARQTIEGISSDFAKASNRASNLGSSTKGAAQNTAQLAEAAIQARIALAQATQEAEQLDDATSDAASNLSTVAGAGRGGGGGGARAGLNLGDPFSALSALESARRTQRQAGFSSYRFVRDAAANVTAQVQNAAQAQLDIAFSQFTSDLVAELNRNGVFNPAERKSFIADRIAEAQRLGVLPQRTAPGPVAAVGGFA